jgi:hypothetical protein
MSLSSIFNDKGLKPKEKTEQIAKLIADNSLNQVNLIVFAMNAKEPVKATCIESLEYATQTNPGLITLDTLHFVINSLQDKSPRIKWESAKVIGNTIHLFPGDIENAVGRLLINTEDAGTVVRWSAAFALGQIIKLKTEINMHLVPAAEAIITGEEKNSIKKIYQEALKKIKSVKK